MPIKTTAIAALFALTVSHPAFAEESHTGEHETQIFHMFKLETDIGDSREGTIATWDLNGWIGTDENKLWLKSEGEGVDGDTHRAEFWAMYSRNVADFWDAQVGVRHDTQPHSVSYLVAGFEGLAPYFFETEAHLFVSDDGDVSVRLRQENDFLVTQRLILQPYVEVNLFAQDVPELEVGSGLADGEIGIQMRYEITRKFAPYVDVSYERKFGETASMARRSSEHHDDFVTSVGLRLMF